MKSKCFRNFIILLLLFFATTGAARAAACVVTKSTDSNDGVCDADCSLREAAASCSLVIFSPSLIGNIVFVTLGNIQLNGTNVLGFGANRLTISATNTSRIFYIPSGASASVTGLTLIGGNGTGTGAASGGAIRSDGTLMLNSVHINSNTTTSGSGGGVYLAGGSNLIRNSTFSHNDGNTSVFQAQGTLNVYNSTFNSNSNPAITIVGTGLFLRSSTISGNSGGITIGSLSNLDFGNSIIAGNINFDINRLSNTTANSSGNNIISNTNTGLPIAFSSSDILNVVPALGPLQPNGGGTPTMALPAGSAAIDRGSNALLGVPLNIVFDQRGFNRIADPNSDVGGITDVGAYEYNAVVGGINISGRVFNCATQPVRGAVLFASDIDGNIRVARSNPFGYYRFINLPAGKYYTMTVQAKRPQFGLNVMDGWENLVDFVPSVSVCSR